MGLFSGDGKKVKKVKQKGKPKRSLRNSQTIETVVEVKTVGDIPPMLEARRLISDNKIAAAAAVVQPENDQTKARLSALKKLILLYLNYYEKSRFGPSVEFGGDELLERFSDVYNYVD